MEAIQSSETSVQSTTSTRRHTPEDGILHSHRRENLKSYMVISVFVGLEVLTAVIMKSSVFWDITPYTQIEVHGRFGRKFRLKSSASKIMPRRKRRADSKQNFLLMFQGFHNRKTNQVV
jgi:hypothetical protein